MMMATKHKPVLVLVLGLLFAARAVPVRAQNEAPPDLNVPYEYDTGWVANEGDKVEVVISFIVSWDTAHSLRLYFDQIHLSGDTAAGTGSILRITSLYDAAQQPLNAVHSQQWQNSSAYFNGDSVLVEVEAWPDTGRNRLVLSSIDVTDR